MCLDNIYQKMATQLKCDMTIGMEDKGIPALSNEDIADFLSTNHEKIALTASDMYDAYHNDNDLAELGDGSGGCNDWYCEFLYEHVMPPNDVEECQTDTQNKI